MRPNKITDQKKEAIRAANSLLTGNVQERCDKLKKQFNYCSVTLASIIKDRSKVKVYNNSAISHMEKLEIIEAFLEKSPNTGMTYRLGILMKKFNRSRAAISKVIESEVSTRQDKYFRPAGEYHGMYI